MFRKVSVLPAILLLFWACGAQAAVIDSNWIGGEWGFWEENANWSSANYPHNGVDSYNVIIDGDVNDAMVKLQNFHTIDSLRTYGRVELDQWQSEWIELTVLNGVTNFGTVTIRCQIRGDINNTPGATLDFDRHMNIFGQLYNPVGGSIRVEFEDMDFEYSSEFTLDYDDLPFFPYLKDGFSKVLQIPIHPISLGRLRRSHFSKNEMLKYLDKRNSGTY